MPSRRRNRAADPAGSAPISPEEVAPIRLDTAAAAAFAEFADAGETAWRRCASGAERVRKVLADVAGFLRARELIVYGGMAIDVAYRAAEVPPLYADDVLPDFDFYSPTHVMDAYALADILHAAHPGGGFRVARAMHVQTMRIFTEWHSQPVADISFLPQNVYERVPTLSRDGVRYVHPHWQFMDMHLSMGNPFGRFPMENVFGRWAKDTKRFAALRGLYPVDGGKPAPTAPVTLLSGILPEKWALSGFAALAALGIAGTLEPHGPDWRYPVPTYHTAQAWPGVLIADVVADDYTPARATARVPAETAAFARTMDFGWPRVEVKSGNGAACVENIAGSMVPFFFWNGLRIVAPHVLAKQFAFWAMLRGEPRYWGFYEEVVSRIHEPGAGSGGPGPAGYWELGSTVNVERLLGSTLTEDDQDEKLMRLSALRDKKDHPALAAIPQGYRPAKGHPPPPFVPRGRWFEFDGRRLSE